MSSRAVGRSARNGHSLDELELVCGKACFSAHHHVKSIIRKATEGKAPMESIKTYKCHCQEQAGVIIDTCQACQAIDEMAELDLTSPEGVSRLEVLWQQAHDHYASTDAELQAAA